MEIAELREQFKLVDSEYSFYEANVSAISATITGDSASQLSDEESSDEEVSGLNVSTRLEDEVEERLVDDFVARGCGCLLGPKKLPCSKLFAAQSSLLHGWSVTRCPTLN